MADEAGLAREPAAPELEPARLAAKASSSRLHLDYLDGVRGAAAAFVAFSHVDMLYWRTHPGTADALHAVVMVLAHVSVNVFIVLSGYVLMLPVVKEGGFALRGGLGLFFARRAARILPPYYFVLVLALVLGRYLPAGGGPSAPPSDSVLAHLFLVHNVRYKWVFDISGPFWSVATEWQIYFVFALVLLPLYRRFGLRVVPAVVVLAAAPWIHGRFEKLEHAAYWYVGLFALGNVAAETSVRGLDTSRTRERSERRATWIAALAMVVAVALMPWATTGLLRTHRAPLCALDVFTGLATAAALVAVTVSAGRGAWGHVAALFASRPLRFLGAISYSLYLVNFLVIERVYPLVVRLGSAPSVEYALAFSGGTAATLATAWLVYRAVERPSVAWSRRIAVPRKRPVFAGTA